MDRFLRYAAYIASAAQFVFVLALVPSTYGWDVFALLMLAIPPILTAAALYAGPDIEERRLLRHVTKARLRQELSELSAARASRNPPKAP